MGLTLDQVKEYLRYNADDTRDDTALGIMLAGGINWIERYTGHLLTKREVTESLPIAAFYDLRWQPYEADSLTVSYLDADYALQEYEDYQLYAVNGVYRVRADWPTGYTGVSLTYNAGYSDADDIPAALIQALALWAGMSDDDRVAIGSDGMKTMTFVLEDFRCPVLA